MNFYYGSYNHPVAEIKFAKITRHVIWSQTQRANILRESWALDGKIVKQGLTSQADVFTALTATRQAYSVNGQSAGMSGTPFLLDNNQAIGGVIVTDRVSHGDLGGSETATYLHYTVGLQMDSFLSRTSDLLSYSEQLSFSDLAGGPLMVSRVPIVGLPILQSISTNSFYEATQSGTATSRDPNIQPEAMLFPYDLKGEPGAHQVTFFSPKMERGTPVEYAVSWSYQYRSVVALTGTPHARG